MTFLTTTGLNGGSLASINHDFAFQTQLLDVFERTLGHFDTLNLQTSITQLLPVTGLNEQESLKVYHSSLEGLKAKQQAFEDVPLKTVVQDWLMIMQGQSKSGQPSASDVEHTANQTLAVHFQSWLGTKLHVKIDQRLPSEFISQLSLGSQATQALQIGHMSEQELARTIKEGEAFVGTLASNISNRPMNEYELSVLTNALNHSAGLTFQQLNNSDFLFSHERFVVNVKNELQNVFSSMGVILNADTAQRLAEKINFVPGISKQDLRESLKTLSEQTQQPFSHIYDESEAKAKLQSFWDAEIQNVQESASSISLSGLFANVVKATVNAEIDQLLVDLKDVKQQLELPQNIKTIKQVVGQDISVLFEKMAQGQSVETDFITRHKKLSANLAQFSEHLKNNIQSQTDSTQDNNEYVLKGLDLFALIDASTGDRLDDKILNALDEMRQGQFNKRDEIKNELEELTIILNLYNLIQAAIHNAQSGEGKYNINQEFKPEDFGYSTQEEFENSPEFAFLNSQNPPITSHKGFLEQQGLDIDTSQNSGIYEDTEDDGNKLSNLSTAISDKSKIVNTDVQLKTEEFSKMNSDYNATIQAMNQIVQKFNSVLTDILRSF